jgi:hypothetical protein
MQYSLHSIIAEKFVLSAHAFHNLLEKIYNNFVMTSCAAIILKRDYYLRMRNVCFWLKWFVTYV